MQRKDPRWQLDSGWHSTHHTLFHYGKINYQITHTDYIFIYKVIYVYTLHIYIYKV